MRAEVLDYLQGLNLGSVTVSTELPWTENDVPLYVKNLKKVYVDLDNITVEPFIQALNGLNISNEITSVRVYFACDAKTLLANYDDVISSLVSAKDINDTDGYTRREVDVNTTIDNDRLITEIELRYIKII